MKHVKSLCILLLMLAVLGVNAQDTTGKLIRGYVYNTQEPPESLPGATVVVQETGAGTITDAMGYYEINADVGQTLVFSFIGHQNYETKLSANNFNKQLVVSLVEDVQAVEEVIVIGENAVQRQHVASSVETVDVTQQLEGRAVTNITQSLQGGVTGLTVQQSSGKPGSDAATINIRGLTTFTSTGPYVLVDGIPMDMNDINPDIIENITVLKDAAAAAIYGARAARGVILIETKRGVAGQIRANYNTYTGIQTPTRLPEFVDAVTYMEMYNEAIQNDGGSPIFSNYDIEMTKTGLYPISYPNTDWVNEVVDKTSIITNHSFNISGGNSLARISLSGRYMRQDGMIDRVKAEKMNLRINTTITMAKGLVAFLDASINRDVTIEPSNYSFILQTMYQAPPTMIAKYPMKEGNETHYYGIYSGDFVYNPLLYTEQGGDNQKWKDRSLINTRLKYNPFGDLFVNAQFNFKLNSNHGNEARKPFAIYDYWGDELIKEWDYRFSSSKDKNYQWNAKIDAKYNTNFGDHKIYSIIGTWYETFANNPVDQVRMASVYGKVNYSYNNKYLLEATARYDGSSRFGENHKWGFFPSFAVGWNMHNEGFLNASNIVSHLKLRASWGQLGNDNIGLYKYNSTIDPKNGNESVIGNPEIQWETVTMTNLGFDLGLFSKQQLEIKAEVYRKITDDMILTPPISRIAGIGSAPSNVGKAKNEGIEVEVNFNHKFSKDLRISTRLGGSYNKNEILELVGGPYIDGWSIKQVGGAVNEYYGYKTDGLLQQSDIDNGTPIFPGQQAGDIKYVDSKPDGVLDDNDKMPLGDSKPRSSYFGSLSIDYKQFDFHCQFTGISKVDVRLSGRVAYPFYDGGKPQDLHVGNYWTPENTDAEYPRLSLQSKQMERSSDFFMTSGRYTRLRNVQLGYTLKKSAVEKLPIRGLRVYVNAQNPYVWSPLRTLDPESRGDQKTHPVMATYSLGLKVQF